MLERIRRVLSHAAEVKHWNEIERRAQRGSRLFWLNHPRVAKHYYDKSLIDGSPWRQWIPRALGRPAKDALELGCGNGAALGDTWKAGTALSLTGLDLDPSRFEAVRSQYAAQGANFSFLAADVNNLALKPASYDLIYAIQSFHHFEALEHICEEVQRALRPGGFFVLDEFVGPARFQWTDAQLALTSQLLGLMPRPLRMYESGVEKREEGRSTVDQVIAVCPSEAIRSNEIVPVFRKHFKVVHENSLGGTIQHLLYSGIVHNFPDEDPATDHLIDCINGLETVFIDHQVLTSDFMLLVGQKK